MVWRQNRSIWNEVQEAVAVCDKADSDDFLPHLLNDTPQFPGQGALFARLPAVFASSLN